MGEGGGAGDKNDWHPFQFSHGLLRRFLFNAFINDFINCFYKSRHDTWLVWHFLLFQGRRNTETPDDKLKRREQAKIRNAMKQRESKRLRMAQSIQRELEEVEVKQADLEQEGVVVEKAMRSGNGKLC